MRSSVLPTSTPIWWPLPLTLNSSNPKLKAILDVTLIDSAQASCPNLGRQARQSRSRLRIEGIDKARFSLKCQICPNPTLQKLYPKIQCTRAMSSLGRTSAVLSSRSHGLVVERVPRRDGGSTGRQEDAN